MTNNYYGMPPQMGRTLYNTPLSSPMGLKGRPVSSIEEARAAVIDFDGMINYFPDVANKRVYTKQFNVDGTAAFSAYELKEIPNTMETAQIETNQFITREEFEAAMAQLRAEPAKETTAKPQASIPAVPRSEF